MKLIPSGNLLLLAFTFIFCFPAAHAADKKPVAEYYQIRVYHFTATEQEQLLDAYLSKALLPALHKTGIKQVGVFKPLANDTSVIKKIYVFIASPTLEKLTALSTQFQRDSVYTKAARPYLETAYDQPPYSRMETILLKAFRLAPVMKLPQLKSEKKERIYELRSYEGPTEKLYTTKVKMFNEGGEIALFAKLGFNAVFYADVISGSRMPNLMYMTSFENREDRNAHWKTFGSDPEWKRLSGLPEYQHTVSKSDILLMHAADYSDF
jgi:NIPSNAP